MIALSKTIRLFLDGIGRRDEYEFYLDKFRSDNTACFALLCPDRASTETAAEMLAFDLHFLLQLELVPAILLCGAESPAMQSALSVEPIFDFHAVSSGAVEAFVETTRSAGRVPVLTAEGAALEEALLELVPAVARRVHFIRAAGGLKTADGELLPYYYTHRENGQEPEPTEFDYPSLGRLLLEQRPGIHCSITSPINLLQEMFTVKGAGTLFRRGSDIVCHRNMEAVDRARLVELLETSFGRKLIGQEVLDRADHIYIEKEYRGAVLLEPHAAGAYLSKFAVGREARGEGLALELWGEVSRRHPSLFWRSARTNRFNSWYLRQADGSHAAERWQIFWRGVATESISEIIGYCCARPEDFS